MAQIPILYEDNHLLVVEKPVNMLSQKDHTGDKDILTLLKQDLKIRYHKPGKVYLGLVHRLDRPAGGVMVFAKTSKAAARLSKQIAERNFTKIYLASVHGLLAKASSQLVHYLKKDHESNIVKNVSPNEIGSKKAVLQYWPVATSPKHNLSLVKIQLQTGRAHQIRVQFASVNHPLVGDQKYGAGRDKKGIQLALWSYLIQFRHPTTKKIIQFKSCLPQQRYPWNLFAPDAIERV